MLVAETDRSKKHIAHVVILMTEKTPAGTEAAGIVVPASAPATNNSPAYLQLTEGGIKEALIEARGDIFVASQLLRVTAIRLNRAIQVSPALQSTLDTVKALGVGVSDADLRAAIEKRVSLYRVAGLDALHDLATMPIDENSAQNQVKLAAAARLAGTTEGHGGIGDVESTLRELNQEYQKTAPRLRVIREKTTIETLPPERVVGNQDASE